jgi:hypothetical protein
MELDRVVTPASIWDIQLLHVGCIIRQSAFEAEAFVHHPPYLSSNSARGSCNSAAKHRAQHIQTRLFEFQTDRGDRSPILCLRKLARCFHNGTRISIFVKLDEQIVSGFSGTISFTPTATKWAKMRPGRKDDSAGPNKRIARRANSAFPRPGHQLISARRPKIPLRGDSDCGQVRAPYPSGRAPVLTVLAVQDSWPLGFEVHPRKPMCNRHLW